MFDVLNSLKNIEAGHFTRRRKLPHSTLLTNQKLSSGSLHLVCCHVGELKANRETQSQTCIKYNKQTRHVRLSTFESKTITCTRTLRPHPKSI